MPKYTVRNTEDGTNEALDPDGTNAKVSFNNSDNHPPKEKSKMNRVVMIVLAVLCCLVILALCAWFIISVFFPGQMEWQGDDFMIETIPGLRYNPNEEASSNDASLISFEMNKTHSYMKWTDVMEDGLREYTKAKHANNTVDCDYDKLPKPGQVCAPDIESLFPCTKENHFGFHRGTPCIFIRFNKIPNWTPEFYNATDALPSDIPGSLRFRILEYYGLYKTLRKTVWLSCSGVSPADKLSLGGIQYKPRPGFPGYYFPYDNTMNYLSPIVAVYFEKVKPHTLINVECRLWAPNIKYDREKGLGLVNFQLMIN